MDAEPERDADDEAEREDEPDAVAVADAAEPVPVDALAADAADDTTERAIEQRRRERLLQEARQARLARFGSVLPIGRDDYTREVTEASMVDEEGDEKERGTGVVCFLYREGCVDSSRRRSPMLTLQ